MRSQLKDSIRTFWLHSTCRSKKHTGESACSCSKSMPTDKPSNRFNSVIATETSPLFSSNCHYKSIAIRHLSNQRDETISSSLANLVETISPAQSDPALTTRKASGIHFDEKSNKVTVNILDNEGSYFEEAFGEAIQKQPSFEKINGSGCNGVLRSNNIRRKSSLSHALQQTAKQRTTLIDRLIASLIADEDNDISEQSSSDEDILLSFSSSSSSPIRAKPRTQSCSLGFTSTWEPTDYNQMRISSTMDALPSTLRSVSRKAFRMSDRTLNYNSDDDDVPLLRVSLTDDDSDTNPMPEPYE
ncbi:unnamed protein product [Toxocara canis]|nr:unnamed protein product [Toxocara canis]